MHSRRAAQYAICIIEKQVCMAGSPLGATREVQAADVRPCLHDRGHQNCRPKHEGVFPGKHCLLCRKLIPAAEQSREPANAPSGQCQKLPVAMPMALSGSGKCKQLWAAQDSAGHAVQPGSTCPKLCRAEQCVQHHQWDIAGAGQSAHAAECGSGLKGSPKRAHDRKPMKVGLAEESVQVRQQSVAAADGSARVGSVGLAKQPGLASLGVQVAMAAEEGRVSPQLPPAHRQLCIRVAKKPPNIRPCTQGQAVTRQQTCARPTPLASAPSVQHQLRRP